MDAERRFDPNIVLEANAGVLVVGQYPQVLVAPALGSCVGVALWDPMKKRGGLAHVMLPAMSGNSGSNIPGRFADYAVPSLVERMALFGTPKSRLVAKIAGGSTMFKGEKELEAIGTRNITAVKHQLQLLNIPIIAEDTGGAHARTVELHLDTGILVVRSYLFGIREL